MLTKLAHFIYQVKVAPFREKHLVEGEKLIKEFPEIFTAVEFDGYHHDLLTYLDDPRNVGEDAFIWVVVAAGVVSGLIMIYRVPESKDYFRISWLVIKRTEIRKGFGKLLVKQALKKAIELGGKYIYVETSDEKRNARAKVFYENMGSKKVGVLPNFYMQPLVGRKSPEDYALYYREL